MGLCPGAKGRCSDEDGRARVNELIEEGEWEGLLFACAWFDHITMSTLRALWVGGGLPLLGQRQVTSFFLGV